MARDGDTRESGVWLVCVVDGFLALALYTVGIPCSEPSQLTIEHTALVHVARMRVVRKNGRVAHPYTMPEVL